MTVYLFTEYLSKEYGEYEEKEGRERRDFLSHV